MIFLKYLNEKVFFNNGRQRPMSRKGVEGISIEKACTVQMITFADRKSKIVPCSNKNFNYNY